MDTPLGGQVALLPGVAVIVQPAAYFGALREGISLQPGRTVAARPVVVDSALCPDATLGVRARIHTLLGRAGLVQWTFGVAEAFVWKARLDQVVVRASLETDSSLTFVALVVGISGPTNLALADRTM